VLEVVEDVPVVARQGLDHRVGVGRVLEQQGREVDACGPALAALVQRRQVLRWQRSPGDRLRQRLRLHLGQAQIPGAELEQLAVPAQAAEWKPRRGAGGDDELDARRQVLEKEVERRVAQLAVDEVVVVEDDHALARQCRQRVEQQRQDPGEEVVGVDVHPQRHRPVELRARLADRPDQVRPEARGVGVAAVQGEPGEHAIVARLPPLREQRSLPVARRRAYERQPVLAARLQQLQEPRPRDVPRRDPWSLDLRAKEEVGFAVSTPAFELWSRAPHLSEEAPGRVRHLCLPGWRLAPSPVLRVQLRLAEPRRALGK
jgi:hypothetical protein